LALGDSSTYGYGLREAEAWPRLVESRLRERGHLVDVVNGGVIGCTVVQGRVRFEELAPATRPRVVLLAFGAVNDHFGAPLGVSDLQRVAAWSSGEDFPTRLRNESALVQLTAVALGMDDRTEVDLELQKRRESWGALDYAGVRRVALDEFSSELVALCAAARAIGAEPMVISMPRRPDFEARKPILSSYSVAVERAAADAGARLVDARGALASMPPDEVFLVNDRVHPTPAGHRRIAELATEALSAFLEGR
jgi:lysophospholipase L1-like esterase